MLQSAYQCVCCCGDYTTVFVVVGTIPQCLLLWGLYDSICCCGDYTTVFAVVRTISQCLWLRGLYHSVLVVAGSVSDSACPSIRVPVAAEERPAAEVCPVSDQ